MIEQIKEHRSIRRFKGEKIAPSTLTTIMEAAIRASNCGNMQSYSIIVSQDDEQLAKLSPCHFGQVERMNAQCVVTICADVARFSAWCRERNAEPKYDNFIWFLNGCIDSIMSAQNITLEAQAQGVGICVLGTTLYTADKIIEILELPEGVIPITSIAMGYPDEQPALTDRLPYEAVIHYEKYTLNTPDQINKVWAETEASALTKKLIEENGTENLAQVFTQYRYKGEDNVNFSKKYMELLKKQGFLNHEY
ncbi:MAG: nitroreductase family protein [Rikenellaceae bacterium]